MIRVETPVTYVGIHTLFGQLKEEIITCNKLRFHGDWLSSII